MWIFFDEDFKLFSFSPIRNAAAEPQISRYFRAVQHGERMHIRAADDTVSYYLGRILVFVSNMKEAWTAPRARKLIKVKTF
jgi:hypothetical protein